MKKILHLITKKVGGLFIPENQLYYQAQKIYEDFTAMIGLNLLGPTTVQTDQARVSPGLRKAEKLYFETLRICRTKGLNYNAASVIYQIGLVKYLCGMLNEAIKMFEEALILFDQSIAEHPNARDSISMCHFYLGQCLCRAGSIEEGCTHIRTAINIDTALGDNRRIAAARHTLKQYTLLKD